MKVVNEVFEVSVLKSTRAKSKKAILKSEKLSLQVLDQKIADVFTPMGKVVIYNLPPSKESDVSKTNEEIKVMTKDFFTRVGIMFINHSTHLESDLIQLDAKEIELVTADLLKVLIRLQDNDLIVIGKIGVIAEFRFTEVGAFVCKKQIIKNLLKVH